MDNRNVQQVVKLWNDALSNASILEMIDVCTTIRGQQQLFAVKSVQRYWSSKKGRAFCTQLRVWEGVLTLFAPIGNTRTGITPYMCPCVWDSEYPNIWDDFQTLGVVSFAPLSERPERIVSIHRLWLRLFTTVTRQLKDFDDTTYMRNTLSECWQLFSILVASMADHVWPGYTADDKMWMDVRESFHLQEVCGPEYFMQYIILLVDLIELLRLLVAHEPSVIHFIDRDVVDVTDYQLIHKLFARLADCLHLLPWLEKPCNTTEV